MRGRVLVVDSLIDHNRFWRFGGFDMFVLVRYPSGVT